MKLHALAVAAVGGVHRDHVALVDEQGNHDLRSGLESDFLEGGGGCGVALNCRLSIGNFKRNVGGQFAGKAALFVCHEHHLHVLAFLHEVGIIHYVVREMYLLIGLFMHEVEAVLVAIEELIWTTFDIDGLDFCTCGESILEDAAILEVTELCLHESGALAGFDVLEPYDHAGLTVEIEVEAVLEISCCCHININ